MIDPFPEDWELVEILGHPELTDPGLPWVYNRAAFHFTIGRDDLRLEIERGSGQVQVDWSRDGAALVFLRWNDAASIMIQKEPGTESIVVERRDDRGSLTLRLKPSVEVVISE